ncbi:hypothetical protein [Photobacterium kishitanii]|uniref:hypothetical protein n=1 Tax=Photobacterium kishitanii TaxID=318456 RepID=UPI0027397814|nr:hypothetical protein [Photobacterium kishitanii]
MKDLIKNLNLLSEIKATITNLKSIQNCEKRLRNSIKDINLNEKIDQLNLSDQAGIYFIEALFPFKTKEDLDKFGCKWGKSGTKDKSTLPKNTTRFYSKKADNHIQSICDGQYIPFYLGKSMNIKSRINTHLFSNADDTTFSLKLLSRPEVIEGIKFRVGYVVLDINNDAYFGVELIEKELKKIESYNW